MEWAALALLTVGAYLLGAIPNGLIISMRLGRDLRAHGSGKTGATNALRVVGPGAAIAVFALDAFKGALPILVARWLAWPSVTWLGVALGAAGLAAVAGHIWSIWIRLFLGKWGGGRGVATAFGLTLAVQPWAALAAIAAMAAVVALTRYVSLGSIMGVVVGLAGVILAAILGAVPLSFIPAAVLIGGLIVGVHHDNIARLRAGTERKFGHRV